MDGIGIGGEFLCADRVRGRKLSYPCAKVGFVDERVAVMARAVDACTTLPVWPLSAAECVEALDVVVAAERQLVGVKLRLVQRVDAAEVAKDHGATSTLVWFRG